MKSIHKRLRILLSQRRISEGKAGETNDWGGHWPSVRQVGLLYLHLLIINLITKSLKSHTFFFFGLLLTAGIGGPACVQAQQVRPAQRAAASRELIANPVLPGDYPDPSVVKIGDNYWASATTSNWGPSFPLLKSKNLTDWELVGHVFPGERPAWADYYFWAPEISHEGGKTYIYYAAHQRGGNLAVGVASADNPAGPYRDHGPLVGQSDGSIDAFPMRDEHGQLFLIWKEDGNSIGRPTPIWAQPMNEERTALTGEKKELFHNDTPWEAGLVEGVSMVRKDGYFYAFYAGNRCCGSGCTYATGVARAKSLLGPWEKYAQNPILTNNDTWKCPGHGTVFQQGSRWLMLHHAYAAQGFQYVGRQGVISEITWTADGWPSFMGHSTPVAVAPVVRPPVYDDFSAPTLRAVWEWPIKARPAVAVQDGQLRLTAQPGGSGAVLAQPITALAYTATVTLLNPAALPAGTVAGLTAHGDPDNALAFTAGGGQLQLWQREKGQQKVLAAVPLPTAPNLQLRLQAQAGSQFRCAWSTDGGRSWQPVPTAANGTALPPWDRGVRVGVLAQGPATSTAVFDDFRLVNQP